MQGNKAKGTLEGQLDLTVSGGIKVEIKTLIFSDSLEYRLYGQGGVKLGAGFSVDLSNPKTFEINGIAFLEGFLKIGQKLSSPRGWEDLNWMTIFGMSSGPKTDDSNRRVIICQPDC